MTSTIALHDFISFIAGSAKRSGAISRFGNFSLNAPGVGEKKLRDTILRTPSKSRNSPSRKENVTPARGTKTPVKGDRFIPRRAGTDLEASHFRLVRGDLVKEMEKDLTMSPSQREKKKQLHDVLTDGGKTR